MSHTKVCLFTAHPPSIGGGSTILRSLTANLKDIEVNWLYTANSADKMNTEGYIGQGIMGGQIVKDIWQTWQMLRGASNHRINEIVDLLLETDCDAYWVVSHNEGLRVALELSKRQNKRPVHMTVHDDWAGALSAKSYRYKFFFGLANKLTIKTLKAVTSVDVISKGMQAYYNQMAGVTGGVCHRYLTRESLSNPQLDINQHEINIGHIGSLYNQDDFFSFLKLVKTYFNNQHKNFVVHMWGCTLKAADLPAEFKDHVVLHKSLPEEQVIPELEKCNFVYSMYPLKKSLRIFSKTSLPTKLTSYILAKRPILGHGPSDCTLAQFLSDTGTGALWASKDLNEGYPLLDSIMSLNLSTQQWMDARDAYFGDKNLEVLQKAFIKN